jgi:hypothetical protein
MKVFSIIAIFAFFLCILSTFLSFISASSIFDERELLQETEDLSITHDKHAHGIPTEELLRHTKHSHHNHHHQQQENEILKGRRKHRVGAFTEERFEPSDEVKKAIDSVSVDILKELNIQTSYRVDSLAIVSYKTQVVAGTNFLIKMKGLLGGKDRVTFRAKVFKSLQGDYSLTKIEILDDEN